jgi:hypothetical protein
MSKSTEKKSLLDAYRFKGFITKSKIKGYSCLSQALVITLARRQKKLFADAVEKFITLGMTIESSRREIFRRVIIKYFLSLKYVAFFAGNVSQ